MIKTGLIRRFDDLGRIVVPKEVRKQVFGKTDLASVPMEFFYEKDRTIIMKPVKETDMNWLFSWQNERSVVVYETGIYSINRRL